MPRLDFQAIAMELALVAAGHKFPRLSQIGAAWGEDMGGPTRVDLDPPAEAPVSVPADTHGYSFFLLDLTLDADGRIALIEANGSNAALSSSVVGKDDRRARHMFLSYASKRRPNGVVLLAYQPSLLHMGEFFGRAGIFADRVAELHTTRLCNTKETLGSEEVSIVCGTIPDIAADVTCRDGQLHYKGRPVVFACNPNLLPELARQGNIPRVGSWYGVDTECYHEGSCAWLVHDKGTQQDLAVGTDIRPLAWRPALSSAACEAAVVSLHADGHVAVGKMNAGSGGAGIEFFPRNISATEVLAGISRLIGSAKSKYGPSAEATAFPIRFFEFVRSTPYMLYGEGHLWDMRMQCLVYPGYVEVAPCVIRLCEKPFDGTSYERERVVSNLTGRVDKESLGRFMRAPGAMRRSAQGSVLESIGVTPMVLQRMVQGCAAWCEAACAAMPREEVDSDTESGAR